MRGKVLGVLMFLFISFTGYSQSPIGKGGKQINLGFGFSGIGLPIYGGMDFGVHEDITVGFLIDYRNYNESYHSFKYKHNVWTFSGNGNYHFNTILDIPREWDFYAGLTIGFQSWSSPDGYSGSYNSGLGLGGQVGGRYYFNEQLGINLEINGGSVTTGGKLGLSIRL